MKRRDFLLFAGVTATTWKPAASEITRIGFIQSGSRQENQRLLDAFSENLSALGWTDGNNIAVFDRWAEARTEALPAIMKELIGSGVAVLVTAGTPATLAAKRERTVSDPHGRRRRSRLPWRCRTPGAARRQRHGTMSELVRSHYRTVGAAAGARPRAASPRGHRQA